MFSSYEFIYIKKSILKDAMFSANCLFENEFECPFLLFLLIHISFVSRILSLITRRGSTDSPLYYGWRLYRNKNGNRIDKNNATRGEHYVRKEVFLKLACFFGKSAPNFALEQNDDCDKRIDFFLQYLPSLVKRKYIKMDFSRVLHKKNPTDNHYQAEPDIAFTTTFHK